MPQGHISLITLCHRAILALLLYATQGHWPLLVYATQGHWPLLVYATGPYLTLELNSQRAISNLRVK